MDFSPLSEHDVEYDDIDFNLLQAFPTPSSFTLSSEDGPCFASPTSSWSYDITSSDSTPCAVGDCFADSCPAFDESLCESKSPAVLASMDLDGIADYIARHACRNIIVMTGAGVSVSAGIPDFRSPHTGLYDNLAKYNLPTPESVFDIHYFRQNPKPFFTLARELYPGSYAPTAAHHFIKLLHDKGLLLRNFTQNIDGLERLAGIPAEKLVEAHGTFSSSRCIDCGFAYSGEHVKGHVFEGRVPYCTAMRSTAHSCEQMIKDAQPLPSTRLCGGLIKPDIVFFGEGLPKRFFRLAREDFERCDLLLVMGTSLQVQPFAGLIHRVSPLVPRLLLNREAVGLAPQLQVVAATMSDEFLEMQFKQIARLDSHARSSSGWEDDDNFMVSSSQELASLTLSAPGTRLVRDGRDVQLLVDPRVRNSISTNRLLAYLEDAMSAAPGFHFFSVFNKRDVFVQSTIDAGIHALASRLGWTEELAQLALSPSLLPASVSSSRKQSTETTSSAVCESRCSPCSLPPAKRQRSLSPVVHELDH